MNDAFRTALAGQGRVFVTAGIAAMSPEQQIEVMRRVHGFVAFTPHNDPYGEHDFGSFEYAGKTIFWKLDCYDRDLNYGSPDPSDENVTTRVMTVMLAEEYRASAARHRFAAVSGSCRFATRICRAVVKFLFGRPAIDHQWDKESTVARAAQTPDRVTSLLAELSPRIRTRSVFGARQRIQHRLYRDRPQAVMPFPSVDIRDATIKEKAQRQHSCRPNDYRLTRCGGGEGQASPTCDVLPSHLCRAPS